MTAHHLIGEYASPALATKLAKELTTFLTKNIASGDDEPTASERALGKKYGFTWSEPLAWEDEPPIVVVIEEHVVMFHPYCAGGLGDDLPKVLKKAGASKVREAVGPPVLACALTFPAGAAGKRLRSELATLYAQRTSPSLTSWDKPVWARFKLLGETEDASLVIDGDRCTLTLPINALDLDNFRRYLATRKADDVSITLATAKVIKANRRREALAESESASAPVVAASSAAVASAVSKPTAIAKAIPTVSVIHKAQKPLNVASLFSNGTSALTIGFSGLHRSNDFKSLTRLGKSDEFEFHRDDVLLADETIWVCGYQGVLRSIDHGKSFKEVPTQDRVLKAIAMDPEGNPWVVGDHGVQVWNGTAFKRVASSEKGPFTAAVTTSRGVVLLSESGRVYVGRHAAISGGTFWARAPLFDACEAPSGTLVVVGGSKKPIAFRSVDGGIKFAPSEVPGTQVLRSVVALPDGRVVAGGRLDSLLASTDDGASFVGLKYKMKEQRDFTCATVHEGAAYLSAPFQELVQIK
jgi:hypothetical protein